MRPVILPILVCSCFALASHAQEVKVRETDIVIPTYLAGAPEPNPMFYFGRQSQGAQAPVYPYPMYDVLTGKKADKSYKIVYLENEYLRIGILPEIGGRIFEGLDKTNNYNFIYRQHVIKPALISIIGAWISGGVEWNINHHHRATTFLPVQYSMEENADGSKTVWVGELEVRQRMRWAVGYTIRPGKSYLEASVRIVNRTPEVNTMLCFANVAVHANDQYQVIFPPSTQLGTGHFKRVFTKWPINEQGVDISWWKNHPSSVSVFAWNYQDDFFAGYDHGRQVGTMSIADHNIVPGKKFFEWGTGAGARAWDANLTDSDGPYIELMTGAYSDNQPDYSWLQPYEGRSFSMHWYPFRDIGGVKNANLDAAVNLEVTGGNARMGFYTTSVHKAATVTLMAGQRVLHRETVAIDPGKSCIRQVPVPAGIDEHDLVASISHGGRELVSYSPIRLTPVQAPPGATDPPAPADVKTNEELYLIGLRARQFHDPANDPMPYWEEALRRAQGGGGQVRRRHQDDGRPEVRGCGGRQPQRERPMDECPHPSRTAEHHRPAIQGGARRLADGGHGARQPSLAWIWRKRSAQRRGCLPDRARLRRAGRPSQGHRVLGSGDSSGAVRRRPAWRHGRRRSGRIRRVSILLPGALPSEARPGRQGQGNLPEPGGLRPTRAQTAGARRSRPKRQRWRRAVIAPSVRECALHDRPRVSGSR